MLIPRGFIIFFATAVSLAADGADGREYVTPALVAPRSLSTVETEALRRITLPHYPPLAVTHTATERTRTKKGPTHRRSLRHFAISIRLFYFRRFLFRLFLGGLFGRSFLSCRLFIRFV